MLDLDDRLRNYRSTLDDAIDAHANQRTVEVARNSDRRRLLAVAAATIAVLVAGLMVVSRRDQSGSVADDIDAVVASTAAPATDPADAVIDESVGEDSSSSNPAAVVDTVELGDESGSIELIERQLADLGFAPGAIDGVFDTDTRAAVWAFQKLASGTPATDGIEFDAVELGKQLEAGLTVSARRPELGSHVEVYLVEQLLIVFDDNARAQLIAHISASDDEEWCDTVRIDPGEMFNMDGTSPLERELCGLAYTPAGIFELERHRTGEVHNEQGVMIDPWFFQYFVAIHATPDVAAGPSTRGSIAVSEAAIEEFGEVVEVGEPVLIWNGVDEPEDTPLDEAMPIFSYPDPSVAYPDPEMKSFAIGDNVLLGAAPQLRDIGLTVDAQISRTFADGLDLIQQITNNSPRELLFIHIGTNGLINEAQMDQLMVAVSEVPHVIVATIHADREWTEPNNELIRSAAQEFDNVELLDWNILAGECQSDCLEADGIHLTPTGATYYTDLIAQATRSHLDTATTD